ncbi:accessory gene regulator B family protein [Paenibacillus polymyxa]|uniref:accessory gene regulator B family protein n=1 Tax=Paenibacillus polymyxa TaxID=1406 RepID=UPI002ED167BA
MLSKRIASEIKKADPDGPGSVDLLTYAIALKLNWYLGIFLTALFGLLLGHLFEALVAIIAFAVLRRFSGGIHLKSLTLCAILCAAVFASLPLIPMNENFTIILTALSGVIILWKAPKFFEEVNPSRLDPYLKWISLAIISVNFFIASPVIALSFMLQSITLLASFRL